MRTRKGHCANSANDTKDKTTSTTTTTTTTTTTATTTTTTTVPDYSGTVLVLGGDTSNGATDSIETMLGEPMVSELPRIRWGHVAFVLFEYQVVVQH